MAEKNEARLLAEEAELFTRLSADFRTRPEETTVVGTFQFVPQQSIEVRLQNPGKHTITFRNDVSEKGERP